MGIKTMKNFTLILKMLRKWEKFANKNFIGKKSVQNLSLSSSILLTCKGFWKITFSRCTFFKLFPRIWNQREILRFWIHTVYEYYLELVQCKFAKNGLTNWKTFLTNHLNKLKNWLCPLLRPKTNHKCHQKPNPSSETFPLILDLKRLVTGLNILRSSHSFPDYWQYFMSNCIEWLD